MSYDPEPIKEEVKLPAFSHVTYGPDARRKVNPYGHVITKSAASATRQSKAWRNYTRAPGDLGSPILLESFRLKAAANMEAGNMSPIHKRNLSH